MRYKLVVCGGTFDHLHKGHREFLRYALRLSISVLIGITTDTFIKQKKVDGTQDYKTRKQSLEAFLYKEKASHRVEIESINNIFIPKVWETLPIESIIVSENTYQSAKKINLRRKEQKKYSLKIEIAPLVKSENNEYISSSRIRNGEINREGRLNINPLWLKRTIFITDKLRKQLRQPFGNLIQDSIGIDHGKVPLLLTVGDITTKRFNEVSIKQDISVVDFKVARKVQFKSFRELGFLGNEKIVRADNPAGMLTPSLFKATLQIVKFSNSKNRVILKVNGEEDLSVLPLVLTASLGAVIFYGQHGKGIVRVDITEKVKEVAYNLVSQFGLSRSISAIDK